VLFYVATARLARASDVGCFVTSAEWLDTRYGAALRRLLLERLGMVALAVVDPRETPFADAMTTAAVVGFRVGQRPEGVWLQRATTAADLRLTVDGHETGAAGRLVPSRQLADASRWSPILPADGRSPDPPPASMPAVEPALTLGQIARVSRGIATGANDFFVMERARAQALGLLPWCHPAITRAREILTAGGVVRATADRKVILMAPADIDRRAHPALDAYLRLGEQPQGGRPPVAAGYLARHRRPWWHLGPPAAPPIIASYMARQAPAFALNPDGLLLVNVAHGLYPRRPLAADELRRLVAALNGARAAYAGHGRTYQGGLEKFEPGEMEALPVYLPAEAAPL
jgi:hypothetical protein